MPRTYWYRSHEANPASQMCWTAINLSNISLTFALAATLNFQSQLNSTVSANCRDSANAPHSSLYLRVRSAISSRLRSGHSGILSPLIHFRVSSITVRRSSEGRPQILQGCSYLRFETIGIGLYLCPQFGLSCASQQEDRMLCHFGNTLPRNLSSSFHFSKSTYAQIHRYANLLFWKCRRAVDFAVASSAIAHTFHGDFNLASVEEVEQIAHGGGRIQH